MGLSIKHPNWTWSEPNSSHWCSNCWAILQCLKCAMKHFCINLRVSYTGKKASAVPPVPDLDLWHRGEGGQSGWREVVFQCRGRMEQGWIRSGRGWSWQSKLMLHVMPCSWVFPPKHRLFRFVLVLLNTDSRGTIWQAGVLHGVRGQMFLLLRIEEEYLNIQQEMPAPN